MERRHSSRRMRAVSLNRRKTHEVPQDDDESMIAEWGLTKAQEVRAQGLCAPTSAAVYMAHLGAWAPLIEHMLGRTRTAHIS